MNSLYLLTSRYLVAYSKAYLSYKALYALHDHVAKSQIMTNEKIKEMASKYQRG